MTKYHVTGRIYVKIDINEIVEAESEDEAIEIAEKNHQKLHSYNLYEITDNEIYCEEVE